MLNVRRRSLITVPKWQDPMEDIARTTILSDWDATSGSTFTQIVRSQSSYSAWSAIFFIDFTVSSRTTTNLSNIICIGQNPESWNTSCARLYAGKNDDWDDLITHPFNSDSLHATLPKSLKDNTHNRAIVKLNMQSIYSDNYSTIDLYINGKEVYYNRVGATYINITSLAISNAEGNGRFYGTYNEISLLDSTTYSREELRAMTEIGGGNSISPYENQLLNCVYYIGEYYDMDIGLLMIGTNGYSQAISTEKMKVVQNADNSPRTTYTINFPSMDYVIFELKEDESLWLATASENTGITTLLLDEEVAYVAFTLYSSDSSFNANDVRDNCNFFKAT